MHENYYFVQYLAHSVCSINSCYYIIVTLSIISIISIIIIIISIISIISIIRID